MKHSGGPMNGHTLMEGDPLPEREGRCADNRSLRSHPKRPRDKAEAASISSTRKMYGGEEGAMTPPRAPYQRHVRYSVRHQTRLDAETVAKLEELAAIFHWKRSAVLRFVMQWGLTQTGGWPVDIAVPGTVRTVGMLLEPELLQRVQEAARSMVRRWRPGYVKPCVRSPLRISPAAGRRRISRVADRGLMTRVSTAPASCCV
jgi:hypothetical protein